MSKKVCSFIGHRPQIGLCRARERNHRCELLKEKLKAEIERQITENGVSHFISGMGLGVDTFAAEIVIDLKRVYPHITLEAAIPCEEQAVMWKEKERMRYFTLVEQCDKETLVSRRATLDCIYKRNQYMVDASDVVIAVWDGVSSGIDKILMYAKEKSKTIVTIMP